MLCQPLGSEYLYAHRTLRQLASRLSLGGFDTLRFDYFGTGDSGGEEAEVDLAGLQADVVTAIETLQDLAATDQVTLIGMRAGANLAAAAAAALPEALEALLLWDPILPGDPALSGVLRELRPIDLESGLEPLPGRTLILLTQEPRPAEQPARGQAGADPWPAVELLPAPCPWIESASTSGVIPARVIQRIEEWLR